MSEDLVRIVRANLRALDRGRVLTVGMPAPVAGLFASVTAFTTDVRVARALGPSAVLAPWFPADEPRDLALVGLAKERERFAMDLAMARAALRPGGAIAVVGANDAGIRGAARAIGALLGEPAVLDARAHHRLYLVEGVDPAPAALADHRVTFAVHDLTIVSYPGLFSHGALDAGTALLLEHVPDPAGRAVLDVGCGPGTITAWAAARGASALGVDADVLAVLATRGTIEANGLTAAAEAADVFPGDARAFDLIISNPPTHAGVRTSTDVLDDLIAGAPARLAPRGEVWLVVGGHLDAGARLARAFAQVDAVARRGGHRVWRARRPAGKRTQA